MITRIEIAGYKSIKSLALDLQPINILLGGNGVGKSNFISLFSLIRNIYDKNFQNYIQKKGGADSLLHFGKRYTSCIELVIYFKSASDHEGKFAIALEAGQESLFIKSTKIAFKWEERWEEFGYVHNVSEANFHDMNTGQAVWVNSRLREFEVYHFHDIGDISPMKEMADIHDNHRLKGDGSNLAAFLYYLPEKQPKHFKRIEMTVKSIAPFFDHFVLAPNRLNEQKIQLEWREKDFPEPYFNAYHLSDGTLRFIVPYLISVGLSNPMHAQTIITNRKQHKKGGVPGYGKFKNEVMRTLAQGNVVVTTLVDYFRLPTDFPGFTVIDDHEALRKVDAIIREYPNPEDINNNPATAPSKRLQSIFNYDKTGDGELIFDMIGIDSILGKCPRFAA